MSGDGIIRIAQLDTDNYLHWSINIEHFFRLKGRCGAITCGTNWALVREDPLDGAETAETPSEVAAETARKEDHAMSFLVLSVKTHHVATFRRHHTGREAWEALEHEFRWRCLARMMILRRDLINPRMGRTETLV